MDEKLKAAQPVLDYYEQLELDLETKHGTRLAVEVGKQARDTARMISTLITALQTLSHTLFTQPAHAPYPTYPFDYQSTLFHPTLRCYYVKWHPQCLTA